MLELRVMNTPATHRLGLSFAIWFCYFSKSEVYIVSGVINFCNDHLMIWKPLDTLWLANTTYFLNEVKSH